MCRFLVFKGTDPILLSHLITKPAHSIINQSFDSRLRLEGPPINADGFGVGWYDPQFEGESMDIERDGKPCIFKAITPAWSNKNLQRLCSKLKSRLVFAHVRASTSGSLSEENCHPWSYNSLLWMHNGGVSNFQAIKRHLQYKLSDEIFSFVNGNTDSEWCFALFLENLKKSAPLDSDNFPHQILKDSMLQTISQINDLCESVSMDHHGVQREKMEPNLLNFCVSDGKSVIITRYISSKEQEAASLFFSTGTKFEEFQPREFRMRKDDKRESIVMVASEPLTFQKRDWVEIPCQTCLVITPKMNVLQFPIRDKYYIDSIHPQRTDEFVKSKGLRSFTLPSSNLKNLNPNPPSSVLIPQTTREPQRSSIPSISPTIAQNFNSSSPSSTLSLEANLQEKKNHDHYDRKELDDKEGDLQNDYPTFHRNNRFD